MHLLILPAITCMQNAYNKNVHQFCSRERETEFYIHIFRKEKKTIDLRVLSGLRNTFMYISTKIKREERKYETVRNKGYSRLLLLMFAK